MQIRESKLALKLTQSNMTLSLLYLNAISFNVNTGGFRGSTSGNLRTTSTSFSTAFNSGLKSSIIIDYRALKIGFISEGIIILTVFPTF